MVQTIGLIIAVYAVARLVQVPIEFTRGQEKWFGMPLFARFVAVAAISGLTVIVLVVLTLVLLASGIDTPRVGR